MNGIKSRFSWAHLSSSVLLLILVSLGRAGIPDGYKGRVVAADGKTPVVGVRVAFVGTEGGRVFTTITDPEGGFELPTRFRGIFTVSAEKEGYVAASLPNQNFSPGTNLVELKIVLFRGGEIAGKILNSSGMGIAGARIRYWAQGQQREIQSKPDGSYDISGLPGGDYYLEVHAAGYGDKHQNVSVKAGQSTRADLVLAEAAFISGKVLSSVSKNPLARIRIYAYGEGSRTARTNAQGEFTLQDVTPGPISIVVSHQDYEPYQKEMVLQPRERLSGLVIELQPKPPGYELFLAQRNYYPGEKVSIQVRPRLLSRLTLELYRFAAEEAISHPDKYFAPKPDLIGARTPILRDSLVLEKSRGRSRPANLIFPLEEAGFYVARVRAPETQKETLIPLVSTDLSLIAKAAPDRVLIWTSHLSSSKPYPLADCRLRVGQQELRVRTDRQGLAVVEIPRTEQLEIYGLSGQNLARAVVSRDTQAPAEKSKIYIFTDRPVYRPGHEVNFKGIVATVRDDFYQLRPDTPVHLRLEDSTGQLIDRRDVVTNANGSFWGAFSISSEPALGQYRIVTSFESEEFYGGFLVDEYRKPEYQIAVTTDKNRFITGENITASVQANYYFGAPVSGAMLNFTVFESRHWDYGSDEFGADVFNEFDEGEYRGYGRVVTSGSLQLDRDGKAEFMVPTPKADYDRTYTIEVTAEDSSRRLVRGAHSVLVTRGKFRFQFHTDTYVWSFGETVKGRIRVLDWEGHPVNQTFTFRVNIESWDRKEQKYRYRTVLTRELSGGADGVAAFEFQPQAPAHYQLEATGRDDLGNTVTDYGWTWVASGEMASAGASRRHLELVTDKKEYEVGQEARILINGSSPNIYALFTVEGPKLYHHELVQIAGPSRLMQVRIPREYLPSVIFSVTYPSAKRFYHTEKAVMVSARPQHLNLEVKSDRPEYRPRDTAVFTVKVTDSQGQPISTEFSFGLVDEAIYAVAPDRVPDIRKYFYSRRANQIITAHSFPETYLGGAAKDQEEVRKDFPDTAYWNAALHTDDAGVARVEVRLPDSLSSWRATVRAAANGPGGAQVGSAKHVIVVTKPLLTRLVLPRFWSPGDKTSISGIVHNLTPQPQSVEVKLEVDPNLEIDTPAMGPLALAPGESKRIDWSAAIRGIGESQIILRASSVDYSDAIQKTVPARSLGYPIRGGKSGFTEGTVTEKLELPLEAEPGTARIKISVNSSLLGTAISSLSYLAGFPYGCMEQTMSRFVPDLLLQKITKDLVAPERYLPPELPKMIREGIERAYRFQHEDGGWGWWEHDKSQTFVTAYVWMALETAREAGYPVDEERLQRAVRALEQLYSTEKDIDARAYAVYALASTGDQRKLAQRLVRDFLGSSWEFLSPYGRACMALAQSRLGDLSAARNFLESLKPEVRASEHSAYWEGRPDRWEWQDNSVEVTSFALRALLAVEPESPLVRKAAFWLSQARRGEYWNSTKDTAAAAIALAEYAARSPELHSNYSARVTFRGEELGRLEVSRANVLEAKRDFVVPAQDLASGVHDLRFELEGSGRLYYSIEVLYSQSSPPATRTQPPFRISRELSRYHQAVDSSGQLQSVVEPLAGDLTVGDRVQVKLTVESEREQPFVILEDPIPSGFEVVREAEEGEWNYWYARRETHDTHVTFFPSILGRGKWEITYVLRAERPGVLHAAPSRIWAMYFPELCAYGTPYRVTVQDK